LRGGWRTAPRRPDKETCPYQQPHYLRRRTGGRSGAGTGAERVAAPCPPWSVLRYGAVFPQGSNLETTVNPIWLRPQRVCTLAWTRDEITTDSVNDCLESKSRSARGDAVPRLFCSARLGSARPGTVRRFVSRPLDCLGRLRPLLAACGWLGACNRLGSRLLPPRDLLKVALPRRHA